MKKTVFVAVVCCLGLMVDCVFGNAFYMDVSLTPDQQGFDIIPSEGTVQVTPSDTCLTLYADPGRNMIKYGNYPGESAGQPFELSVTTKLSGRGALGFTVGNCRMSVSSDPIDNVFWVAVFDEINSVYKTTSGYIDTTVTHEYRALVDAAGDYSVFVDSDEVMTGSGWTNGDLAMVFNGDFSYAAYSAEANIYECYYNIPEPCSLVLLSLGGLFLTGRCKKQ